MKSKKLTVASAFIIGTLVFVSAAFADMAIGSGYDNLKDSIKQTAQAMEDGLNNYTTDTVLTLKSNGKVITQNSSYMKTDNQKKAYEEITRQLMTNGQNTEYYRYSDEEINISKNSQDSKYFVTKFVSSYKNPDKVFHNPFDENGAPEFEKIVDAVVGSLKSYVQVQEKSEGGVVYSGSLNEAQIPALANAVSAFVFKTNFTNRNIGIDSEFTSIEKDVFIKSITGKAEENKDGIIENLVANIVVQGLDKNGAVSELELEAVLKLTDINSTVVVKPDMTGKDVVESAPVSKYMGIDSKYIGSYKNDIIVEKDGKFTKIGERNLIIAHVDEKSVSGRYFETVNPGFETLMPVKYDFTFDMPVNGNTEFSYKNPEGKDEKAFMSIAGNSKLYLHLNVGPSGQRQLSPNVLYDDMFSRVFE